MTLDQHGDMPESVSVLDFSKPQRDKAVVHSAVDPPLCKKNAQLGFFDLECPECLGILYDPNTTISQIFSIIRHWTPDTQKHIDILVKEILKRGAHVDDRDGLTDMTLLQYACKAASMRNLSDSRDKALDTVKLLIARGADVFIRCRWTNMTALHLAVYFDLISVTEVLLGTSGAIDIDSPCSEYNNGTPLHIATSNLSLNCASLLLDYGANDELVDINGRTPYECIPNADNYEPGSEIASQISKMKELLKDSKNGGKAFCMEDANHDNTLGQVTLQSLGLEIGDHVVVGGAKVGTLRFCGATDFAPGVWAGIELDEEVGKNNGSVGGVTYFTCSPGYGIFAPISRVHKSGNMLNKNRQHSITLDYGKIDTSHVSAKVDTEGGMLIRNKQHNITLDYGTVDTSHVKSRVDTGLSRTRSRPNTAPPDSELLAVNDRVLVAGQRKGFVRYTGETKFAPGWWYGIELDRPVGKNDGEVNGVRYFTCKPKHGVFAPPSRVQIISGQSPKLTKEASKDRGVSSSNGVNGAKNARPRSSGVLPKSTNDGGEMKLCIGMSVLCNNEIGVLRYIGTVDFEEGTWLGLELRTASGKNDGSVQGRRYFSCKPNHGLIVRPSRVTVRGINGAKLL